MARPLCVLPASRARSQSDSASGALSLHVRVSSGHRASVADTMASASPSLLSRP
jgi:hypothetical protein